MHMNLNWQGLVLVLALMNALAVPDLKYQRLDPGKNIRMIAGLWSAYLGHEISDQDMCNMIIMLKLPRLKNTSHHKDSLINIIGYTLLKEMIKQE